jgi:hypothetical protein
MVRGSDSKMLICGIQKLCSPFYQQEGGLTFSPVRAEEQVLKVPEKH